MRSGKHRPKKLRSVTHKGNKPKGWDVSPMEAALPHLKLNLDVQRLGTMAALAVLVVLLLNLLTSPSYIINDIIVKGNQGTSTQDVQDAASFVLGRSAFLVRTSAVREAVTALQGISRAEVRVSLPNRLEITLSDTRPEVMWVAADNVVLWVDKSGLVRDQAAVEQDRRIMVRDLSGRTYAKGDKVDAGALAAALQLGVSIPKYIQHFEYQREEEITVVSPQGWRALFNTHDSLEAQITALQRFLASGRAASLIDVRVPDRVRIVESR